MTEDPRARGGHNFSSVSAVHQAGSGRFDATIDSEWTIAGKPNGGYLLAMMGRASSAVGGHRDVVAANAHYLRSPDPGAVVIEVELLRGGRSASQLRASLRQDDKTCVEALITTADLDAESRPFWDRGVPERSRLGWEDCPRLQPVFPDGQRVAIMDHVEVRLEPESSGFVNGRPSGRGQLRGWLSLPEGEQLDPCSLLFALDAFPPSSFDIEFSGWVPTLELTTYVRALPAPGPVQVLQRAALIEGGRVDETCFVWDSEHRLVAHGTQLAGIRLS